MKFSVKTVNGEKLLIIFEKSSIIDVSLGPTHASDIGGCLTEANDCLKNCLFLTIPNNLKTLFLTLNIFVLFSGRSY